MNIDNSIFMILTSFIALLVGLEIYYKIKKKDFLGTDPTSKTLYKIGKASVWLIWIGILVQSRFYNFRMIELPYYLELTSFILIIITFIIFILSYISIGESLRVGLPKERTKLKTKGIYRFSRNPIYVAFITLSIAAIIYTVNIFTIVLAIIATYSHHKIILGEEQFLERSFGKEYKEYKKRVRRYL